MRSTAEGKNLWEASQSRAQKTGDATLEDGKEKDDDKRIEEEKRNRVRRDPMLKATGTR